MLLGVIQRGRDVSYYTYAQDSLMLLKEKKVHLERKLKTTIIINL